MKEVSKTRMIIGTSVMVIGFISPLFIPIVTSADLSTAWKTGLSGALAIGIPEIFMVIAIAIMGKSGYEFIKSKVGNFIHPILPPDQVSLTRYRIGLILFITPLIVGWAFPYLSSHFASLNNFPIWYYVIADLVFISSFFVLGGDFWDKLKRLFKHEDTVNKLVSSTTKS